MSGSLLPSPYEEPYMTRETLRGMPQLQENLDGSIIVHSGTCMELLAGACVGIGDRTYVESSTPEWHGADFDTCIALALSGWHAGVQAVESLYARITSERTNSMIPSLEYSDEPDGDVDVERWLQGDDEHFLVESHTTFTVNVAGTFATFVLDPFASCGQSAEDVLRRGTYLVGLVYLMERAGFRTRVMLRMPTCEMFQGHRRFRLEVSVKEYGQVLDLPRVMFWIAHPAALRQVMIAFYRQYREDAIYSDSARQPIEETGVITSPPYTHDEQLDGWLKRTLDTCGLRIEV